MSQNRKQIKPRRAAAAENAARWREAFVRYLRSECHLAENSVLAYEHEEPVGMCLVAADDPRHAAFAPGRSIHDSERLNILAIGVRSRARGRGVNYAMAAHAFLELARRGHTHVSYTLVLDDNWPSRRTGEGLGASVCANYLTYRRNFRR